MHTLQISIYVLGFLIVLALVFDFMNGFHDAANAIATVVSTGVLKPQTAVAMAAVFNFVAIFVFHLEGGGHGRQGHHRSCTWSITTWCSARWSAPSSGIS